MKKFFIKLLGVCFAFLFVLCAVNINFNAISDVPSTMHMTLDDLNDFNSLSTFGSFVKADLSENIITVGGEKIKNSNFQIKLFGFIPIKTVNAVVSEVNEVYLGGIPLGFSINTEGLIVIGKNNFLKGGKSPFKNGDIITKVNDLEIEKPEDISNYLKEFNDDSLKITIKRGSNEKEIVCVPYYDDDEQIYKLGLWVKDDAQGIGTLTFVTKDGKFGALGHSICDYETGVEIPVENGGIYNCNLVGINKAKKGSTGEMRCLFSQSKAPEGEILKNTKCGVFGSSQDYENIVDINLKAPIGNRMLIKLGKAKIVSAVGGLREEYDIEIIKTNYQNTLDDKSFVFRVIDKKLISLTGGIVQGMSGSPIIQNGKIIGAVTHVFLNDATKGYGVYIDWMMDEVNK